MDNVKRTDNKSHCPINFSLETFGDPWSLLIVRDIVYFGKKTYGDFACSEERIATNMLACRLACLEQRGILIKKPHPVDKRKEVYELTEEGLTLVPVLLDLASWGACHDPSTEAPQDWIALVNANKEKMVELIQETVRKGGSVFVGPDSVVAKLAAGEYRELLRTQSA